MRNTFVIHIGTEKTGTTAIQRFLGTHQEELVKYGVLVAGDRFSPARYNNLHLAYAAAPGLGADLDQERMFSFEEYQVRVREHISSLSQQAKELKCNKIVYSSEHFSSRLICPEDLEMLKSLFPAEAEFEIVVYVRPQRDLYLSALAQEIKEGGTDTSFSDPRLIGNNQYGLPYYDYEVLLTLWENAFPHSKIVLRPYDVADLLNRDVIADFLSVLGVTYEPEIVRDRPNKRLSPEAQVFLASINEHIDANTRFSIVRQLEAMDLNSPGTFIHPDVISEFATSFSSSNSRVALKYLNRDELFITPLANLRVLDISVPAIKALTLSTCAARLITSFTDRLRRVNQPTRQSISY